MEYESKKRKKNGVRIVWLLCLALLSGLFLVGVTQLGVLMLSDGRRGVFPLTEETAVISREADGSWQIRPKQADVFPYIERLQFGLQTDAPGPADISYVLELRGADGGILKEAAKDRNPAYVGTEVLRLAAKQVQRITIQPGKGTEHIRISDVRIDNSVHWNPYVFVFGSLAAFGVLTLLFWRKALLARPALTFLLLALSMGSVMVLSLPRMKVGADEETHLQAVMDVAAWPFGELNLSDELMYQLLVSDYNDPTALPANQAEQTELDNYLAQKADYREGRQQPEFVTLPNRVPAYLTMAAAVKLGKMLHWSWPSLLLAARFVNLLTFALLMMAAIHLAPFGKRLLLVIGLFPQSVFLASTVTYDAFVIGMLSLGMAALFRVVSGAETQRKTPLFLLALLSLFLGCLPKAVYAPLLLVGLSIPAFCKKNCRSDSSQSAAARIWMLFLRALPILLFALLILSFILPTVIAPAETGDLRGGATSEVSQVGYILSHPFAYALLLLRQMLRWIPQCFFWADCTTFMGHLVNGSTASHGLAGLYALLLVVAVLPFLWIFTEKKVDMAGKKVWCFLMIGACAVLIWTSMYVAFTEPGAQEIAGVQGRYFLPLLYPLYVCLMRWQPASAEEKACGQGKMERVQRGKLQTCLAGAPSLWYDLTIRILLWAGLAVTIWQEIIRAFCL